MIRTLIALAATLALLAPIASAVDPVDYAGNTTEKAVQDRTESPCGGEMFEYHEDTNEFHWHPRFACFPPP